jgi:DNA-binding response OmpR family regulator
VTFLPPVSEFSYEQVDQGEAWSAAHPVAIIIEPQPDLAHTIQDAIAQLGFESLVATTHTGAAVLAVHRRPALMVVCVPAPGDLLDGAYLSRCRQERGEIATVLLLSDHGELHDGAPDHAITLLKPFTCAELMLSVDTALASAHRRSAGISA